MVFGFPISSPHAARRQRSSWPTTTLIRKNTRNCEAVTSKITKSASSKGIKSPTNGSERKMDNDIQKMISPGLVKAAFFR